MKSSIVSKAMLRFLNQPTALLSFMCMGLAFSVLDQRAVFLVFVFALLFLTLKTRLVTSFILAFILGCFISLLNQLLLPESLKPDCHDSTVISRARNFGSRYIFQIESKGRRALVKSDKAFGFDDKISVCFKLNQVESGQNRYLLSQYRTDFVINNPSIEFKDSGRGIKRGIYDFSDRLSLRIKQYYIGDEAILARGLILGGSSDFSDYTKANLKRSGASHIVAVSGYNVSILTVVIFDLLRKSFSKNTAGIITPLFLLVFYLLTGGSASVLRASIMGVIVLASKFIGRRVSPFHLLVLSLTFMLLLNPYAIYDIGFLLSFAAISGIFFMSENMNLVLERLFKLKNIFIKILSETISAQIFTLPVLLASFGLFSLVAPLTNLLILPLVPLAMFVIFLSLLSSLISVDLGIFISSISAILMKYFLFIINFLGSLKIASFSLKISPYVAIALFFAIIYLSTRLERHFKNEKWKLE